MGFCKWQLSRLIQCWKGTCLSEGQRYSSILLSHKTFFTLPKYQLLIRYLPFHGYQPPVLTICIELSELRVSSRENHIAMKGKNGTGLLTDPRKLLCDTSNNAQRFCEGHHWAFRLYSNLEKNMIFGFRQTWIQIPALLLKTVELVP